jgi:hypothetical protein
MVHFVTLTLKLGPENKTKSSLGIFFLLPHHVPSAPDK